MPRIQPVNRTTAPADTQSLLDGVEKKLGMVPNLIATMAQSPALAKAYMSFSQALAGGLIPAQLREQIALAIGQANQCGYCLAAHSAIGSSVGLSEDQLRDARTATSPDRKTEAALQFARRIVQERGFVSDDDLEEIRHAGYGESEIAEIIGHVALNMLTNYFNHIAETEIDFPVVAELVSP
ncbi:MAG: carboxymuconolactone decarboxylase family protein [Pirellulales bacterium]|nr:carboxymuconolactone decarboxylase family protein [Pirellulales bacterium]